MTGVGGVWRALCDRMHDATDCRRHMLHFLRPSLDKHGTGPRGRFRLQDSANRATITDRETGALVRALGSDPRRLHGAAPRLLLYDEVAQWPSERVEPMLAALKTSRGKIPGSKALWLGTRPSMPGHPFQRALDGHGVGFALCYAAPKDAPPFRRSTWKRANPGLDHLPDLEAVIRQEAADAKCDESGMQSFLALRLNQGVSDTVVSVLVEADTWRRAEALPALDSRASEYVLGLDLGQNAAMSAAAAYFRDGALEAVVCFPELPGLAERAGRWRGRSIPADGGAWRAVPGGAARVRRPVVTPGMPGALGPAGGDYVRPLAAGRAEAAS